MLGLAFGLVLATSGLNDPGLQDKGLDGRTPDRPPIQVLETVEPAAGDATPNGVAPGEWDVIDVVITETEKRILRDYFDRHPCAFYGACDDQGNLPPGLAKKDHLPPGLARQLARNGTLPPGLAKRDLPPDLISVLPTRPANHYFVIVDEQVLLVERATNVILDALEIVLEAGRG